MDLCLKLFPWARFRSTKGAVKLHTLLDLRGSIPTVIEVTEGRVHDVNVLDTLVVEPGAFYVFDRGYTDFARLKRFTEGGAWFVIRAKRNLDFARHRSMPIERSTGVRSDQLGRLRGADDRGDYAGKIRRVHFFDNKTEKHYYYLTNNLTLAPEVIAALYKSRWQVELFFKWIKQHLRIRSFYGTSANAVKTQVWIATCVYLTVAIIKKELNLERSLHSILQILSVSSFEKVPLDQLLTEFVIQESEKCPHNQLTLNFL